MNTNPQTKSKPWEVLAYYFRSGNEYTIAQFDNIGFARIIRDRAKSQLSATEAQDFTYIIAHQH